MSGFGANPTTTTQGSLATNQFPTPSVAVPGTANGDLTALEGGPASTDSNNNKTAPVSMYVKDGGDIVQGTTTDAANANTVLGQLKQIKTNTTSQTVTANAGTGNFTIVQATGSNLHAVIDSGTITANHQQADLTTSGTISAAQSGINTPVSNATISLAVGTGQSTWKAQLLAGGGGFTGGTTIVADKSPDGGTTWYSANFKVAGAATNTPVSSIVGPGPIELTGNAAGVSHVRIRCSVLNSTETITVTLRGASGVGDIGILSPLPAGSNLVGGVNLVDSAGTNKATISSGGAVKVDNSAVTQPVSGTFWQATQPVSAASLPLPTGASTSAKQPALGTAGSASSDVLSVQGVASMTALKTDGSGVTQPVSGTVTANAGTNMSTASLALESGGNLATLAGGVSSSKYQTAIASIAAALTQANQIPVSTAAAQGKLTLTVTSNSGTFTNNLDNTITFSGGATVARRIRIQNESAGTIYWETDATASTGSPSLVSPAANAVSVEWIAIQCTTLHIWIPSGGTTTLNGTSGVKVTAYA